MTETNILILMPQLFMGGSERQVRYIAEGLEKNQIKVTVLVENGNSTDEENKSYIEKHPGIQFVFLGLNTLNVENKTIKNKIKSLLCINKWIRKYGKKYTWAMFTNLTGLLCVSACKKKGMKVLFNERNPGIKMCNSSLKRKLLRSCNKVVANSKSAAKYMSERLGLNVECINNGIVQKEISSEKKNEEKLFLLVPARINPVKNQMAVIKAVQILHKKIDLECCFAGQIEDQSYYDLLNQYVNKYQLGDYISFPGYIKNIDEYYGYSDLIILASYEEGTPNVVLEAYLNKKPCLASDIVMNRDISVDKRILFDTDDAQMLADKIMWITNMDRNELNELLDKEYEFVKNNYSLNSMQNKYVRIFSE